MERGNFIGGECVTSVSGDLYTRRTPYDQAPAGSYQDSDPEDIHSAVIAAREAFDNGSWPRMPAVERSAILRTAAATMRDRIDEFTTIMTQQIGQPGQRAAALAEVEQLEFYANLIVSRRDDAVTGQRSDALGVIAREPIGVVGAITAWNAPLSIGHKACPALAAGCTVVVKPAHQSPGALLLFAEILRDSGLPNGAFNVVTSAKQNGAPAGAALAAHPQIDMITFTGSSVTGRAVMQAAAANLTKVHLELGGKSPHVVFADAPDLDKAAAAAAKGIVRLTGQSCQAGSRLLVQDAIKDEFVGKVVDHMSQAQLGDPFAAGTSCGPLISAEQLERVASFVDEGRATAKLVLGGRRPMDPDLAQGFFFEPTLFDEVPPDSRIAQEEIFGPVLSVMSFTDLDDAVSLANRTSYGLAAGCWSSNTRTALQFASRVRAGIVWVNGFRDDSVLKHMPMGGYKNSGLGREWGVEGLDAFLERKSIMIKFD